MINAQIVFRTFSIFDFLRVLLLLISKLKIVSSLFAQLHWRQLISTKELKTLIARESSTNRYITKIYIDSVSDCEIFIFMTILFPSVPRAMQCGFRQNRSMSERTLDIKAFSISSGAFWWCFLFFSLDSKLPSTHFFSQINLFRLTAFAFCRFGTGSTAGLVGCFSLLQSYNFAKNPCFSRNWSAKIFQTRS